MKAHRTSAFQKYVPHHSIVDDWHAHSYIQALEGRSEEAISAYFRKRNAADTEAKQATL